MNYGEPWKVLSGTDDRGGDCFDIQDCNSDMAAEVCCGWSGCDMGPKAERIVACVNFLAGIPTEDLLLLESDVRGGDAYSSIWDAIHAAKAHPLPLEKT